MVNKKILFFIVVIILAISCGSDSDPDCDGSNFAFELDAEVTALSNAAISWATDPSSSNCNAFKNAYQSYIDALRPYRNCTFNGTTRQSFDRELDAAEQGLDQLNC